MFQRHRFVASAVYLLSMILTLWSALWIQSTIITLMCIMLQMCALAWYCMSYIPFAREMMQRLLTKCLGE